MKLSRLYLLAISAALLVGCARQQGKPGADGASRRGAAARIDTVQDSVDTPRRLESFSWNPVKHRLTWDISRGEHKTGEKEYHPVSTDHYEIYMDDATMTYNGETRRFNENEATKVRVVMDVISRYAADSTVWWEEGQGDPVDGKGNTPATPRTRRKPLTVAAPAQIVSVPGALFHVECGASAPLSRTF